jgi:hypothetical protein
MTSTPNAASSDEIANLLARLETRQQLDFVIDGTRREWKQMNRDFWGPRKKLIAEDCMTVGIEGDYLEDHLCIHLVRFADFIIKGASKHDKNKRDDYKQEILQKWKYLKTHVETAINSPTKPTASLIPTKLQHIYSEMNIYEIKWMKKLKILYTHPHTSTALVPRQHNPHSTDTSHPNPVVVMDWTQGRKSNHSHTSENPQYPKVVTIPQPVNQVHSRVCSMCNKNHCDVALLPCGHLWVCNACCKQLQNDPYCPFCKRRITHYKQLDQDTVKRIINGGEVYIGDTRITSNCHSSQDITRDLTGSVSFS